MTQKYGVRLIVQYYPLYKYPLFQKMGFGQADCPNLEKYWPTSYSYPWWCGIPSEDLEYMAESTYKAIEGVKLVAAT
jgi:perosamine synthetase